MTQTEKKYNQYLGKLYWSANREYDDSIGDYKPIFDLVMPTNLERRYGHGRYMLTLKVLKFNVNSECVRSGGRQEEYRIEASYFIQLVNNINQWHQGYILAQTGELEKDVAQIKKAC